MLEIDKVATVRASVDRIISMGGDDEAAHSGEDDLMQAYIRATAPVDVLLEFERLWAADFSRWCA